MVTSSLQNLRVNIKFSMMTSMLIHGGLLVLATLVFEQKPQVSPLPLGVELAYVEAPTTAIKAAAPAVKASVPEVVSEKVKPVAELAEAAPAAAPEKVGIEGQGNAAGTATAGREGVANGTEVDIETRYVYELRKLLERKKTYPQMAKAMGQQGTVQVRFTLDRSGKVVEMQIEKGAHPALNEATLKLIRSIEGLKPFPENIAKSTWTLSVPVEYSLR